MYQIETKNNTCQSGEQVNHPAHYNNGKYECIDVLKDIMTPEQFEGFCLGNTVKYIWRAGKKNPGKRLEDLRKSKWYLDTLLEGETDLCT